MRETPAAPCLASPLQAPLAHGAPLAQRSLSTIPWRKPSPSLGRLTLSGDW